MKKYYYNKRNHDLFSRPRLIILAAVLALATGTFLLLTNDQQPKPSVATSADQPMPTQPQVQAVQTPPSSTPLRQVMKNSAPKIDLPPASRYPVHNNIVASMFYVGETASTDNGFIANAASAWDRDWQAHFGGKDSPSNRSGWSPAGFNPQENPFYIALPYNDRDHQGQPKTNAKQIYWYAETDTKASLLKNRWVKLCANNRCAYGQWQDVGPFESDDVNYVFGGSPPKNETGLKAGIDVSPAINDYLNLGGHGKVSWTFVDEKDMPQGPWRTIITTRL